MEIGEMFSDKQRKKEENIDSEDVNQEDLENGNINECETL